ncbi:MAG: PKD domain-containing protein, partial [Planctomycetota bacterium]
IKAGQAVQVSALSSNLNAGDWDTAHVEWDFGNPNGQYNVVPGYNAAHLYEQPGTYTIRLKVYNEQRGLGETTVNVNVSADNRQAFYVSQYGSDSNSGTSSSQPLRTLQKAFERVNSSGDSKKILLKRGETFDVGATLQLQRNDVIIDDYGSGNSKPSVRWTRGRFDTKAVFYQAPHVEGFVVRDLELRTDHNDTDSRGMPHGVQPSGKNTTVFNNTFRNMGDAVSGNAVPDGVLVLNNVAPDDNDIRRYFVWGEGENWTILGNEVTNSSREHIIRLGNAKRVNIGDNDLENKDRRPNGDPHDYAKGVIVIQKGSHAYVHGNTIKGPWGVGPLGDGDGLSDKSARFKYAIFEGNESRDGHYQIEHGSQHVSIRSNVLHQTEPLAFKLEGYDYSYGRGVRDVRIVNNTIINQETTGRMFLADAGQQEIVLSNNLYVAPNLYTGPYLTSILWIAASDLSGFSEINNNVWADASADPWADGIVYVGTGTSPDGFRDENEWLNYGRVRNDVFSDVNVDSSYRPTNASLVNVGKREEGVFRDFYGNWRPNADGRAVGA